MLLHFHREKTRAKVPTRSHDHDAGYDLFACPDHDLLIGSYSRQLVPTGIAISLPEGVEASVRPRSGLALKKGVTVLNSPGTIDPGYMGEIGVILATHNEPLKVYDGMKIAQIVFHRFLQPTWSEVNDLGETERGTGGFGHTGEQ